MNTDARSRLRRSLLITPGNRPERLRKAGTLGADGLVLDLEDGVPPASKAEARAAIAQALPALRGCGSELWVRINPLASGLGADDLAALPLALVDAVMVPKVESADELRALQARLDALERAQGLQRPVELVPSLETPRGVLQALAIAEGSGRNSALFFGSGDYTAATGAALTPTALLFARSAIAAAAGAACLQAIDAAWFLDVKDPAATRADALAARELGFAGKLVFHPAQVAVANEVFSPTPAEVARAERIVQGYREAAAQGRGTALAGGEFVAIDLVAPAERLLQRAVQVRQRAGATPEEASA